MGSAFDLVVAVDWSAASGPVTGENSIWLAASDGRLHNPPTRAAAAALIDSIIADATGGRVLIGVDVAFGYPAGTSALLGLGDGGWRAMWGLLADRITDDAGNHNDRFDVAAALNRRTGLAEGPFWGCPATVRLAGLRPTRPRGDAIARWRACERALRAAGLRPSSVWQLAYAGSVGGQALTAIPVLERLRRRLAAVEVWPLTTGFTEPTTLAAETVVLAEVWPAAFAVDRGRHPVKDAAQVLHVAAELHAADHDGRLAGWLSGVGIAAADRAVAVHEEAWILGPPPGSSVGAGGART